MRYLSLLFFTCLLCPSALAFEAPLPAKVIHPWVQKAPLTPTPKHEGCSLVLSVDGGGIRGLIPALVLDRLEQHLSQALDANIHIADFFDIMAGTSTGSIIALGLSVPKPGHSYQPKYKAETLVQLYQAHGQEIFPTKSWWDGAQNFMNPKYDPEKLEALLRIRLGETDLTQCLQQVRLIVPAFNLHLNQGHFFESEPLQEGIRAYYDEETDQHPLGYEMRHVARASSAAPTYFPGALIHGHYYVDGGVFANNPSMVAYTRARKIFPHHPNVVIISLGTGQSSKITWDSEKLATGGKLAWAPNFPSVSMKGVSDTTHDLLQTLMSAGDIRYHRLQVELEDDNLDDASPKALEALKHAAETLIHSAEFQQVYAELYILFMNKNQLLKQRLQELSQSPYLDLANLWFANPDWGTLSYGLYNSNHLTHVTLRRCEINAQHIEPICQGLRHHAHLTYLDLSENDIGEGMEAITHLATNSSNLRILNLNTTLLETEHVPWISMLCYHSSSTGLPPLEVLSLSQNRLGVQGVCDLMSTLGRLSLTNLQVLLLESVGLTIYTGFDPFWPRCFEELSHKLPQQGFCSFYGNDIARPLKRALHNQYPNLSFYNSFTLQENLP